MTKLQDFLNSPVNAIAPAIRQPNAGDLFGIEVECEGKNVGAMDQALVADWIPHNDGSLRAWNGHPPCEWVFNGPANYKQSVDRVNKLFDNFEKHKAQLHCSNRTSVHIHFNMGDKTAYQLVNVYILFTILEDLLDSYCGDDRNGNLFCLSSRHAEGQLRWLEDAIFKHYRIKFNENWRYCSLNIASLNKFGTIEFRGMRGLDKREDLLAWLSMINQLCTYGCYEMKNPVALIEAISMKSPEGIIREVFDVDNAKLLLKGKDPEQINASVYEGMRLVQMLCYKIGTEFDQVRLRGKDFWASFQDEDAPPKRDVEPEDFDGPKKVARPRGARIEGALDVPFRGRMQQQANDLLRQIEPNQVNWVQQAAQNEPAGWGGQAAIAEGDPMLEAARARIADRARRDRQRWDEELARARRAPPVAMPEIDNFVEVRNPFERNEEEPF